MSIDVNLGIDGCSEGRLAANRVMLCSRTAWILETDQDIKPYEFFWILTRSNSAGIVTA